jgi:sporulation protein YlmC with PRC-barrel domain
MRNQRILWTGLLVVSLVAALCAYALAAESATAGKQGAAAQPGASQAGAAPARTPSSETGREMMLERTSQMIGKEVKDAQGQNLGVIRDIVLTPNYEQVSYVALSAPGTFTASSRLYAIPWQALHVGPKGEITTSITPAHLKQATGFTSNDWPSHADMGLAGAGAASREAASASEGAAGTEKAGSSATATPPAAPAGKMAMGNQAIQWQRVTHLTGLEVKNPQNQDLGDIEDFAINTSNGHVVYDIISLSAATGTAAGEKFAAVPASAVRIEPQNHVALLNATLQTLESVAFAPNQFPNLGSPEYMTRLSKLFPAAPAGSALGYTPPEPKTQLIANERAWGAEGPHGRAFNPSTVKTITGTIESVGGFKPQGAPAGASPGLRLRVKTTEGQTVIVYAGPAAYAERRGFFVMPGDQISITGSETKMRGHTVVLASEVKKGSETLELRDKSGKPLWSMGPSGPAAGAPTRP